MTNHLDALIRELERLCCKAPLSELMGYFHRCPVGIRHVAPYVRFSDQHYTRNPVAESPHYRALVLCWLTGQRSPIHDHAESTCAVRVLQGVATETLYELTPAGLARPVHSHLLTPGTVFGSQDSDLHLVSNDHTDGVPLITLHVYSPPLDAEKMRIYLPAPQVDCSEAGRVLIAPCTFGSG